MKVTTLNKINYFFSPAMNKFYPRDTSETIVGYKKKSDAIEAMKKLNIEKIKTICNENQLSKYIPDSDNFTKTQEQYIKDSHVILDESFVSKMTDKQITDFMQIFKLDFYMLSEIEVK